MKCMEDLYSLIGALGANRQYLDQLKEQVEVGITMFIGSGLSAPFGYPSWREFIVSNARAAGVAPIVRDLLKHDDYEQAATELYNAMGAMAFHEAIRLAYNKSRLPTGRLKGAITYLPGLCSGPVITTNYDAVLEKAFADAGRSFREIV